MTHEQLYRKLHEEPFQPFRILVSDGSGYDVKHPESMFVTKNRITIAIYDQAETPGEGPASREAIISPLHITSMVDLPERAAAN